MPDPIRRRPVRSLLAALALGVALPAGAAAQGLAGPYLAAEQAAARGDIVAAAEYYARAMARDAGNPRLITQAMIHQLAAGRLPQAVALANQLAATGPEHHVGVLVRAADGIRADAPERALAALPEEDTPFVGRIMRAWALHGLGRDDEAVATLSALEDDGTGGPAGQMLAAYHTALIEAAQGDDADAAEAIARASERAGARDPGVLATEARILARLGRPEDAVARIDALLAEGLTDARLSRLSADIAAGETPPPVVTAPAAGAAEALYGVARHLTRGPNWMVGVAYTRLAAYLRPDFAPTHMLVADTLFAQDQFGLAIASYEAVPDGAPEALDARIGRANALAGDGKLDEAISAMRGLVVRYPDSIEAHTALGDILRRNELFAEAAAAYDGAVALVDTPQRRHWPLFYQRGISYERSKQWPSAEADFKTALELEPDQPLVLNYLGYSWVDMGMNLDEAQEMIETAVEQRPDDGYIVDSLGWVKYRLGEFEAAVKHLGRAVELAPVDPVINDHYGDALWMVGRRVEAEFQWRRALSFDPEEDRAERIRLKLEIGLDKVQAAEAEAGTPAIIGRSETADDDNDGG